MFIAQAMAATGHTLDASPVRDAFLLTAAAFTGLSGYTLVSRRDFSNIGAALTIGLFVLIGASLPRDFVHADVFHLAVASMGVLLFAGYILYDTSRIMRTSEDGDAVGAALRSFLDIVNMFSSSSASSRRRGTDDVARVLRLFWRCLRCLRRLARARG